jgi:hypothetical protein
MGLSGNNSVSMAWNVLMKKVKYWIMLKMGFFLFFLIVGCFLNFVILVVNKR